MESTDAKANGGVVTPPAEGSHQKPTDSRTRSGYHEPGPARKSKAALRLTPDHGRKDAYRLTETTSLEAEAP